MKILLTGGAGFIGSHTAVELINNGYNPIILDDFRNSNALIIKNIEKIIGKKVGFYSVDIGNKIKLREIIKKENPIGIIHFAADKSVNESVLNPLKYYKNNISNLVSLIELVSCNVLYIDILRKLEKDKSDQEKFQRAYSRCQ